MPSISETTPTESQLRDKQFSKALHGDKATNSAGYLAILKKDSAAQKQATSTYFQFWDNKTAQNETEEDIKARAEKYTDLVNSYYNIATDLYEYGWNEKFHFCRFYPGESFEQVYSPLLPGLQMSIAICRTRFYGGILTFRHWRDMNIIWR